MSWLKSRPIIKVSKKLKEKEVEKLTKRKRKQDYKDFYTLGQIYERVLKHVTMPMRQICVCHNVRALLPNIFIGLHFYFSLNQQFRHFILHRPKV